MLKRPDPKPMLPLAVLSVYWAAMVTGTHIPAASVPHVISMNDLLMHFCAYGGLAFLVFWCLTARRSWAKYGLMTLLAVFVIHAAIDEATQVFVPGRVASVSDWLADTAGATLSLVGFSTAWRWWTERQPAMGESV